MRGVQVHTTGVRSWNQWIVHEASSNLNYRTYGCTAHRRASILADDIVGEYWSQCHRQMSLLAHSVQAVMEACFAAVLQDDRSLYFCTEESKLLAANVLLSQLYYRKVVIKRDFILLSSVWRYDFTAFYIYMKSNVGADDSKIGHSNAKTLFSRMEMCVIMMAGLWIAIISPARMRWLF